MDFLNKVNAFAKAAADKTSEVAESARLKAQIAADEKSIRELQAKIGDYYYQQFLAGETVASEVLSLCTAISVHKSNIQEKKAALGMDDTVIDAPDEDLFEG